MKKLIIFLWVLIALTIYAQDDIISVKRGSGRYLFNPVTMNKIAGDDYITFYGNIIPTKNDTGGTNKQGFIAWKYTNGVYDSTRTLGLNEVDPIEDTTGFYYCSVRYKTQGNNWIWVKGVDSSFTTNIKAPINIYSIPEDTSILIGWADVSSSEARIIPQRNTDGGESWTNIDTIEINSINYRDGEIEGGNTYYYRVKYEGDNAPPVYSTIVSATAGEATYEVSYVPTLAEFGSYDSTLASNVETFNVLIVNKGTGVIIINSLTGLNSPYSLISQPDTLSVSETDTIIVGFETHTIRAVYIDTILIDRSFQIDTLIVTGEIVYPPLEPPTNLAVTHNSDTSAFLITWNGWTGGTYDSVRVYSSPDNSVWTYIASRDSGI